MGDEEEWRPPRTPGEARVDDVYLVLHQWTFVAREQCVRLDQALNEYVAAIDVALPPMKSGPIPKPARAILRRREEAFYRVSGNVHFLLSAVSHVVRCLDADGHLGKLPRGLHDKIVTARVHPLREAAQALRYPEKGRRFRASSPDRERRSGTRGGSRGTVFPAVPTDSNLVR